MSLSKDTIKKLKNFATINPNIVYGGSGKLKTISEAKNILAETDIEDITKEFSVYDLNELISTLSLIEDGDVQFGDGELTVKNDKGYNLKYTYADPNILTKPTKDIAYPEPDVTFTLTESELNDIRKASSSLGNNTLQFIGNDKGTLTVRVTDNTGSSKNAFWFDKEDVKTNSTFNFDFLINNLKVVPSDYEVSLSSKLISRWVGNDITYFIALEKSSNYSV
jgi:hypothetical protein